MNADLEIIGELREMEFDKDGNLKPFDAILSVELTKSAGKISESDGGLCSKLLSVANIYSPIFRELTEFSKNAKRINPKNGENAEGGLCRHAEKIEKNKNFC